jgi:uncharacterized protein (TIGR03000 family)
MFRKALSFGGLLLIAGATVLVTPDLGQARGGGGGHGGGGFHGGGWAGRGWHGGGGHYGGWGYRGGWGRYGGLGYYGYGAYPYYYGGYDYYPDSAGYNADTSGLGGVTQDSGYYGSSGNVTPSYPYGYYSLTPSNLGYQSDSPPATDNTARVTLTVPAGARVTFGGAATSSTGTVREYQSPPLTPGRPYTYDVEATWSDNGKEVTQTQHINLTAGARVKAAFPIPPAQQR